MSSSPIVPEEEVEGGEYKRKQIPGGNSLSRNHFNRKCSAPFGKIAS